MNELFSVKDKVIILTGGSGILGACMARHLAKEGARVVILDRVKEAGDALVAEIKAAGGEALFLLSNVLDRPTLEQNKRDILQAYGSIDVLVNLAGGNQAGATIPPDKTIFDLNLDAFRGVVELNLFGTVLPTIVFAEVMVRQQKGSIINISSESALRPLTRVVGYGCAKAAISNFTQYMAGELATKFGEGLRVNALAPGFFLTEQNRALMSNPDGTPSDRCNAIVAHTPFRRLGQPEELLGTLQWLASDASAFVTGTVTPIDGGFDAFSI
jgi:NAD(P)-dependent dehydrogenase (short-subunit alcohol dehydrogenase family)